ncbi:MAG: FAD:protein FMN transferase [Clostridia bacterium]|nr:FAD:protein FMN transferase [Clostridia bacterium]
MKRFFSIFLIFGMLFNLCGCKKTMTERHFFAMDTMMSLNLDTSNGGVFELCEAEVERLESLFSTTVETSDIARLNRGELTSFSADTLDILKKGLAVSKETDQAFCMSLYPASRLWDFGGKPRVPSKAELEAVRPMIDDTSLMLVDHSFYLPKDAGLDLGGIAKGYAADSLAVILEEQGVEHYFLSLGGNVQVKGGNLNGEPWRIGIADPMGGEPVGIVPITDGAVVTSGGYERNFVHKGKTYHHILDRATLSPAGSGLISATAITADGTTADALSTAFFVMGEEKALRYCADHMGVDCVLITEDHRVVTSDGIQFSLENKNYTYS